MFKGPLSASEVGPGRFLDHEYLCVSVCVSLCVCMCSFVLVCVHMRVNVTPRHMKTHKYAQTQKHTPGPISVLLKLDQMSFVRMRVCVCMCLCFLV